MCVCVCVYMVSGKMMTMGGGGGGGEEIDRRERDPSVYNHHRLLSDDRERESR